MFNVPPKNRSRTIVLLSSALLAVNVMAQSPRLCNAAQDKANYDSDYLDNFITLKDGKDGWLFRDSDLKTQFGPSKEGYRRLHYINKLLNQRGTTLMMVPIPTRGISQPDQLGEIDYDIKQGQQAYRDHLKQLRKIGMRVPELDTLFKVEHEAPLFFARDHHWTSYGAEQVARLTAKAIKQQAFYPDLPQQTFETSQTGTIVMDGSHQKAAAMICEHRYPEQTIDAYSTENISELDLFGDMPEPEVILVGTSNSNAKLDFNFSGYLMQYSGLDILNLAKSGGGYDGAILDYLKSDDFKTNPAKLLIWEVPGYYSLNSKSFYKKMVRILKQNEGSGYANNKKNNMEVTSR